MNNSNPRVNRKSLSRIIYGRRACNPSPRVVDLSIVAIVRGCAMGGTVMLPTPVTYVAANAELLCVDHTRAIAHKYTYTHKHTNKRTQIHDIYTKKSTTTDRERHRFDSSPRQCSTLSLRSVLLIVSVVTP